MRAAGNGRREEAKEGIRRCFPLVNANSAYSF
jgi:hypothetical protein